MYNSSVINQKDESMDSKIQLKWWIHKPNFGDLLSPWLIKQMTGRDVEYNDGHNSPTTLAIGSIVYQAMPNSTVWGSGLFGTEQKKSVCSEAEYKAVRGPLTRNLLRIHKIQCPEIYGDPALLCPLYYNPVIQKKYKVGVVLRWSERVWNNINFGEGVKKIFLLTDKIEDVINEIKECEMIMSSSLHGVIIADAYGIPSAWIASNTPKGLAFKYYDYFLSVNKVQQPQFFDPKSSKIDLIDIIPNFKFDNRAIDFDYKPLLEAFPFEMK